MLHSASNKDTKVRTARRWSVLSALKSRLTSEDGNATIESVLWMPFFVALFALIADGSMVFNKHSNVLRIVHDANRALSVGRIESGAETEQLIRTNAAYLSGNMTVSTVIANGIISTVVEVPVSDLDMTGLFAGITDATLTINAQHYLEL